MCGQSLRKNGPAILVLYFADDCTEKPGMSVLGMYFK